MSTSLYMCLSVLNIWDTLCNCSMLLLVVSFSSHQIPQIVWRTLIDSHPYSTPENVIQGHVSMVGQSAASLSKHFHYLVNCVKNFMISSHAIITWLFLSFTTLIWKTMFGHSLYFFIFRITLKVIKDILKTFVILFKLLSTYYSHLLTLQVHKSRYSPEWLGRSMCDICENTSRMVTKICSDISASYSLCQWISKCYLFTDEAP